MSGYGAVPRCGRGNEEEEECRILSLIHVERIAKNCTWETSGFPLGNSLFMELSLEDNNDHAPPVNLEMMGKSWNRHC